MSRRKRPLASWWWLLNPPQQHKTFRRFCAALTCLLAFECFVDDSQQRNITQPKRREILLFWFRIISSTARRTRRDFIRLRVFPCAYVCWLKKWVSKRAEGVINISSIRIDESSRSRDLSLIRASDAIRSNSHKNKFIASSGAELIKNSEVEV